MNEIVCFTHPLLHKATEPVTEDNWPSENTIKYMVALAIENKLLYLTANQIGINRNYFVASLKDGIYRTYINPYFRIAKRVNYVRRTETTPHNDELFAVSRPQKGVLYYLAVDGSESEIDLIKDAAANAHAACSLLVGRPPWTYDVIGDW